MVRITEGLIRRRAEHNEGQLTNLEEVSLHQQDIERIENIDKWCRELKILYLQSNLIHTIENVGRLKKLEYINLALNNIERVENLEACESLKKLDLTVNFIGELTSIECLSHLEHFNELFLTGNPCTEYEYYKEYVVATLPHLKYLDGKQIVRSDRIRSEQVREEATRRVIEQQKAYQRKRVKEKEVERKRLAEKQHSECPELDGGSCTDVDEKFWGEAVPFTPESRIEVHEQIKKQKGRTETDEKEDETKRERRLLTDDGRVLNINEGKIDFTLEDDIEHNQYILNLEIYRFMDTSLIDIDVQPGYVRATIRGKIFQLVLPESVNADSSSAKRSQLTGHLMVEMPKATEMIRCKTTAPKLKTDTSTTSVSTKETLVQRLEVDSSKQMDLIIAKNTKPTPPLDYKLHKTPEHSNDPDFVDDPDVPLLE